MTPKELKMFIGALVGFATLSLFAVLAVLWNDREQTSEVHLSEKPAPAVPLEPQNEGREPVEEKLTQDSPVNPKPPPTPDDDSEVQSYLALVRLVEAVAEANHLNDRQAIDSAIKICSLNGRLEDWRQARDEVRYLVGLTFAEAYAPDPSLRLGVAMRVAAELDGFAGATDDSMEKYSIRQLWMVAMEFAGDKLVEDARARQIAAETTLRNLAAERAGNIIDAKLLRTESDGTQHWEFTNRSQMRISVFLEARLSDASGGYLDSETIVLNLEPGRSLIQKIDHSSEDFKLSELSISTQIIPTDAHYVVQVQQGRG